MEFKYETKKNENSQVILTITVPQKEVKNEFDKLVRKTQKDAVVSGFRKGKVPISILAMKYKEMFLSNTTSNIVEDVFKEVYEKLEEKPLGYSIPKLKNEKKVELDKDFSFELEYEVYPEVSFGEYKGIDVTKDEVTITNADIQKTLDSILKDFSTLEEKTDGVVEKGDIVYITDQVFDDGKEVDKNENDFVDTSLNMDRYGLAEDLIGMKKNEEKDIVKKFGENSSDKDIAGKELTIKIKINSIYAEKIPELTEELISQIKPGCKTEEELRNILKKELENYAKDYTEAMLIKQILDNLVKTFKGGVPESMIKAQSESTFKELVRNFRGDERSTLNYLSKAKGIKSKEEYLESVRKKSIVSVERALITNEIQKKENITVTEDEIKETLRPFAEMTKMNVDELFDSYKKRNQLEEIENQAERKKVIEFLINNANVVKTNKLSYEESKNKKNKNEDSSEDGEE